MFAQTKKNSNGVQFTILFDNRAHVDSLQTSWGFSCLVEGLEKTILFDTGADGEILLQNMKKLGIDIQTIDIIILSHDHWDHVGGLKAFLSVHPDVDIYLLKTFSRETQQTASSCTGRVTQVTSCCRCCKGVYTTGSLGKEIPEQSLVIETDRGMILITGCAHPGIVDIAETVKKEFERGIFCAFGGFHLKSKSEAEIDSTISRLQAMGIAHAGPSHCSGELAITKFKQAFENRFMEIGVGRTFTIH